MNETLGKWSFWIMFIGFNIGFFPMHIAGLMGMPRRIYTYSGHMGWNTINMVTSIGAFIFATGILIFMVNVLISLKRGGFAGDNPWDAATLEWSVPSPPKAYNFAVIPLVASRHPLWEDRLNESSARSSLDEGYLLLQGRETLATTPLDARPDLILKMPQDSYAPFYLGLFCALMFAGLLLHWWDFAGLMAIAGGIALTAWLWPSKKLEQSVPAMRPAKETEHG
jgi:hypothetical protein